MIQYYLVQIVRKEMQTFLCQRKVFRNQSQSLQVNFMFLCYVIEKTLNVQQTTSSVEKKKMHFLVCYQFFTSMIESIRCQNHYMSCKTKFS